ncbi:MULTISPECIES: hypothetical protein [Pectobacterium]|uniref:hypothetical protein n=1 Tax=Pectobacterium TaxID=122277 RepID=UPI000D60FD3C|nr:MULTISPECIES: hypothetical protein [Pectobacterium]MBA0190682.1 hypothetical protein [Pectobacterium odoriferum]PWD69471.1 hypothetical protein DF215_12405 [Pectobacterium versatile]
MKIVDYIDLYFEGNKSAFARRMNVTPQQVTKWVNDGWIIFDGQLYSPRRELASGEMMQNIKYLAEIFGGAEYALAEIRELNIRGPQAIEIERNSKKMIDLLLHFFKNENYQICMIGFDSEQQKYLPFPDHPLYELGAAYFHTYRPGSVLFAYKGDLRSDRTFEVGYDPSRFVANRFDSYAFTILFHEVQMVLSQHNTVE